MPIIHGIGGEKGGCGKSQVALAIAAFYESQSAKFVVCEADRSNGDVGRAYEGKVPVINAFYTENPDETENADGIIEAVLTHQCDLVLNYPAQAYRGFQLHVDQGSLDFAVEQGVKFVIWFVTTGEYDSISLLLQSVQEMPFQHILVRNQYFTDRLAHDYSDPVKNEPVAEALSKFSVPVVNFPKFTHSDVDLLRSHALTFMEAINGDHFKIAARSRLHRGLRTFLTQLESLEVFNHEPPATSPSKSQKQRSDNETTRRKARSNQGESVGSAKEDGG
jgi:hypothetical protein